MISTQFFDLLDAVGAYYGNGSDQWLSIARQGINAEEAYSILCQTPNVNVIVSKNGDVLGYNVVKEVNYTTQPTGGIIDSNIQAPATTDQLLSNYPAEMAVDAQTGLIESTSGMTKIATGAKVATVSAKVATAVGAVMAGCQIGAQVDQFAYDTAPDLWDDQGMWAVNPQTWDSICTTDLGKDLFNIVFGIDKESHVLQAYMDRRAVAQIAQYMQGLGCFDTGSVTPPQDTPSGWEVPTELLPLQCYTNFSWSGIGSDTGTVVVECDRPCYGFYKISGDQVTVTIVCGDGQSSTPHMTVNGSSCSVTQTMAGTYVLYENIVSRWTRTSRFNDLIGNLLDLTSIKSNVELPVAFALAYGSYSGGVEGINKQPDATFPTGITRDMTTDQVIGALSTQYPDMIQGALSNDVIQPDGSIKTITYWPVGMPDNIPVDQITGALQPVGGVNTLQDDTALDDTKPDESLDAAIDLIASPNPQNPTDRIEKTYPDTGEGSTPPAVLPTGSAQALYAVYNPSQSEVNSFGAWLWDSNFFEQLKKLFNDPMQSIIGLHKIFATPSVSGRGDIYVGYLDSGVPSNLVANQYTEVDCGEVSLYEYFGNVLDYSATDIYIYLPFIGIVPLDVEDIMRATINVKYKVDVLTGACLVMINVTRDGYGGQLYTYSGNCSVQYPLSSGSYMGIVASAVGIAGSIAGTILTGGAMLPVAIGAGASALNNMKSKVEHSGSLSGNAGAMGIKKPYLIIRRPQTAIADNFEKYKGGSNNIYGTLSTFHGFTQVKYVNLEGFTKATLPELLEIERLLKSGVLIN